MKLSQSQLREIIDSLPDIKKHPYDYIRVPIPRAVAIVSHDAPLASIEEVTFAKSFDRTEWLLYCITSGGDSVTL